MKQLRKFRTWIDRKLLEHVIGVLERQERGYGFPAFPVYVININELQEKKT